MGTMHRLVIVGMVLAILLTTFATTATATSQWSRKYGLSCTTCHSAFPRLNYYGQRFMRNGYQLPDDPEADGDTAGKREINDITFIGRLQDYFGVRLSVTPIKLKTNALVDGDTGEVKDQLVIGNADWAQFFVAGSIAKDISIFIEMAFNDEKYHYSWYKLGFHNLGGSPLANVIVGNVPARDYGAYPNRLRIMGPVKGDVFGIKSAGGANSDILDEAPLNSSGSRPAIQYYGYQGPVVVWGGVSPGDNGAKSNLGYDLNDKLHYWGGFRLEATEDMDLPIEGSAISAWYYQGTDTGCVEEAGRYEFGTTLNEYTRMSVETEVRAGDFELMAAYVMGKDGNWNLSEDSPLEIEFTGISAVGGYMHRLASGHLLYCALQYDDISSDDVQSLEKTYLTPSISFFPRENVRIGLYGRIDMSDVENDEKMNEYSLNIRTMF